MRVLCRSGLGKQDRYSINDFKARLFATLIRSHDAVKAWNIRPGTSKTQFWLSSEFVESSLIFFYGSTNIFLEHLAGWGKAWSARDLQHVAITVLFIGGGLVSFVPAVQFHSWLMFV